MKSARTMLGLTLLAACLTAGLAAAPACAGDTAEPPPPPPCDVPAYLLTSESSLPKVTDAIKSNRPLNVLVVGSRSSTIQGNEASAYPATLQAALKEALPSSTIDLSVELQGKSTAEETAGTLVKLVEAKKPTLVIWQTGTVDAMRAIDPDDFRTAINEGVVALRDAGTDVVLVNLQYSPRYGDDDLCTALSRQHEGGGAAARRSAVRPVRDYEAVERRRIF
ncbi:hypothetical protein ACVI1K_001075 [Bradyrhizobium sp. USDA 4508]